jgi:phage terminase large subunit-like protein
MSGRDIELFRAVANREPPKSRVSEFVAAVGRGGGKDSIASLIATVTAINFDPRGKLRPGEKATVMCLACDRSQAGIVFGYIRAYFEQIPSLAALVAQVGAESIEFRNHVVIAVHTNSFRAIRGRTLLCVIFDEAAFFRDETSASPDLELD